MAGDEHDRQVRTAAGQPLLQLEPAHARQAHVEDQAAGRVRERAGQELLRRREHRDAQPDGAEQVLERRADRGVVVDDEDHGLDLGHDAPKPSP